MRHLTESPEIKSSLTRRELRGSSGTCFSAVQFGFFREMFDHGLFVWIMVDLGTSRPHQSSAESVLI